MKELAQEFGVDARTIQRYFNLYLKDAGVPLKKIGKRWAIDEERLGIVQEEESRLAFEALEEMAKEVGKEFYLKVRPYLQKLHSVRFNPFYTKLDFEDMSDRLGDIALLEKAIKEKRQIVADYKFDDRVKEGLELKPVRIANFEGFWYLLALDARNDKLKKYYLKHLFNIRLTDETFEIDEELQKRIQNAINVWFEPSKEPFEVVLFADALACKYLKRLALSPSMHISGEDGDGSCEVRITISHPMEIVPFVKRWTPHILVMEPQEIKEMIEMDTEEFLKLSKGI